MKPLFKIFPQLEPELIEALETVGMVKTFAAGDTLMRPGQFIKSSMLILEGMVKIYREN